MIGPTSGVVGGDGPGETCACERSPHAVRRGPSVGVRAAAGGDDGGGDGGRLPICTPVHSVEAAAAGRAAAESCFRHGALQRGHCGIMSFTAWAVAGASERAASVRVVSRFENQ